MKLRSLILAIIVLLSLVGILYWSNHRKPADEALKPSETSPAILKLDESSITKVDLKQTDTEPIVLIKSNSGAWQITAPQAYRADQANVSSTLSSLASLNSERVVDDKPSDLKQYGLAPSPVEVNITENDNKSQKLLLGDATPTGNAVYTMLAGDPRVFTIASYNKNTIAKSLTDFRNKKLFDFGFTDPAKLEMHSNSKAYSFTRTGRDWWSNGKKMEVESIAPLLSDIRDLAADKFADSGFTNPAIDIAVTSEDGKLTEKISIAKSGDSYIARRESDPTLYHLTSATVDDLLKAADNVKPAATAK